ncbi:MAG: response regulator [Thermoproteota archaeon]|nr:response regulator [Thermoproteota archaeon]
MVSSSILVVDDEESLANMFRQFLVNQGFDAIYFTDPLLACEHYRCNPNKYSLIITDLRMPGMSGIDLSNNIRQLSDTVKIVLITAFDLSDLKDRPAYKHARIDLVIQKPVKFSRLRKIVDNVLKVQNN